MLGTSEGSLCQGADTRFDANACFNLGCLTLGRWKAGGKAEEKVGSYGKGGFPLPEFATGWTWQTPLRLTLLLLCLIFSGGLNSLFMESWH